MTLRCFHLSPLLLVPLCFRIPHAVISVKRSLYLIIIIIIIIFKSLSRQSSINPSKADSRVRWFNYTSVAEIESAMEMESISETLLDCNHFYAAVCSRIYRIIIIVIIIINIVLIGVVIFSVSYYTITSP